MYINKTEIIAYIILNKKKGIPIKYIHYDNIEENKLLKK